MNRPFRGPPEAPTVGLGSPAPRALRAAAVLALAVLWLGCAGDGAQTGTHIGNPVASAGFALGVATGETDGAGRLAFHDSGGLAYGLTEARVYVRDIRLDLPNGTDCDAVADALVGATCVLDDGGLYQVRVAGPFAIDLLARQSTPDLSAVRVPAVSYQRIDFRLDEADPDDGVIAAGDELVGRSLVARADFTYMATPVVLTLLLRFNEDARFESPGGVAVPDGGSLLALLDVGGWLDGVSIGSCLDAGDLQVVGGRLVIDENAGSGDCGDIERTVKDNVKESGQLSAED